jgi:hypothetical protein
MSERRGPKVQKDHMDSYCLQQPAYYCQAYGTAQMGGGTGNEFSASGSQFPKVDTQRPKTLLHRIVSTTRRQSTKMRTHLLFEVEPGH